MRIDLNSDMGESFGAWTMGDDAAMLGIVSTANVACGWHAGDPMVMYRTCEIAKKNGVAVGAHPSFNDREGFGRRVIRGDSMADIEKMVAYQIGALQAVAKMVGHKVTHVKPHGALGNLVNEEDAFALAVGRAIKAIDPALIYVTMPSRNTEPIANQLGLKQAREFFADRSYDDNGQLTSRKKTGAVIHDAAYAAERVARTLGEGAITTISGTKIKVSIDTICVHGDTPAAVAMAAAVRTRLERDGYTIKPFVD
ncbi:MAG: 5-oxoprolinase subunit PxpA [Hyphomicrobiaceae bacterium]|nr:5-oxoprolinase subunit PxpA [Hyphomicrobiaceae bacterium]